MPCGGKRSHDCVSLEERNRRTRTRKEITGGSREEYKHVTAREPGWVSEQRRRGSGSRWVERRPKDELLASFAPTGGGEIEEKRAGRCRVAAGALPAWRNSRFQRWRDSRVKSEVWP